MRITQEADYALRIVLNLSKRGYGQKVEAKVLAEEEGVPLRFLLKLLRKLKASNIVESYRGVNGGYALIMQPEDVTLRTVIESIDGEVLLNKCMGDESLCNVGNTSTCRIHKAFKDIQTVLLEELDKYDFKKLIDTDVKLEEYGVSIDEDTVKADISE